MAKHCVSYQYLNFLYFVVKMPFRTFARWQVKTSRSLEGIFSGGLINRGKKPSKKI